MSQWWLLQNDPHAALADDHEERLIAEVERFEQAWNAGHFLGTAPGHGLAELIEEVVDPALRALLLADLCAIDLERRVADGQAVEVETYLGLFPELGTDPWAVRLLCRAHDAGRSLVVTPRELEPRTGAENDPGTAASRFFQIKRPHATGSLSEVFIAFDQSLQREVALKRLAPAHAGNQRDVDRFLNEARVTAGLEHPAIAPVHVAGILPDGLPFYVSKLIRGQTLEQAIAGLHGQAVPLWQKPVDPGRLDTLRALLRSFVTVCHAAGSAHNRGFIHRDIKPSNILVGPFDETYLIDWGLARAFRTEDSQQLAPDVSPDAEAGDDSLAEAGTTTLGTIVYASPEQVAGDPSRLSPRADVYSLGATLYHLLVGQPPFPVEAAYDDIVRAVLNHDFPPPGARARHLPEDLEAVCLKAMRLNPEARYPDAEALARDVLFWLEDQPVTARDEPWPTHALRWAKRHQAAAASLLLVAMAVLAAVTATGISAQLRHAESRAALAQLDSLSLPAVAGLVELLAADREYALRQIDNRLQAAPASQTADQRRVISLVRLGLDPERPQAARSELAADPSWSTALVDALLAHPPVDLSQAANLRPLLAPLKDDLIPELVGVLRGALGVQSAEIRQRTAEAVFFFLAREPQKLALIVPDLPDTAIERAVALLRKAPAQEIGPPLRLAIETALRGWPDMPPDPRWTAVAPEAEERLKAAQGFLDPHFAFAQALPIGELARVVDMLRSSGYRPSRVRPYAGADGGSTLVAAVLWTRDGLPFFLDLDLSSSRLQDAHRKRQEQGFMLGDLAAYLPALPPPSSSDSGDEKLQPGQADQKNRDPFRYLGLWCNTEAPRPPGWNRPVHYGFQGGWNGVGKSLDIQFETNLTPQEALERQEFAWSRPDRVPWTVQIALCTDGSPRLNRTWALLTGTDITLNPTFEPASEFQERRFHQVYQRDLATAYLRPEMAGSTRVATTTNTTTTSRPELWLAGTWAPPASIDSQILFELDLDRHLEEAGRLALEGYRPSALAVGTSPDGARASSLWIQPAEIGHIQPMNHRRKLRAATALYHLGDPEPLFTLCQRGPDPTPRFLLDYDPAALGFQPHQLLEHVLDPTLTEPGLRQTLLLALGGFSETALQNARISPSAWAELERLHDRPDHDPGVAAALDWLLERLRKQDLLPKTTASARTADDQAEALPRMSVVRGPAEFLMGESRGYVSAPDEYEARHLVRIDRDFAIAVTEVTVADFKLYLDDLRNHPELTQFMPARAATPRLYPDQPDVPATGLSLAQIAGYANWLSHRAGLAPDQWCFLNTAENDGTTTVRLATNYLERTGVRLPTEAEWEFASRAGSVTTRPFGQYTAIPDPLAPRYCWHEANSTGRPHGVAQLWPNDLGLFDILGNVREICLNSSESYCQRACDTWALDTEESGLAEALVSRRAELVTRGGGYMIPESGQFSSHRLSCDPYGPASDVGFRLARTLKTHTNSSDQSSEH